MSKFSHIAAGLAFLLAVALQGCGAATNVAPSTSFAPSGPDWIYAHGVLYHRPHYALVRGVQAKITPAEIPFVPYQGGLVTVAPKFYLIFWDYKKYGDANKLAPLLETYTKNMGGSGHNNIETQYYENTGKKKKYITNAANQFGGSWDDESPIAKHPTDADVAAESLRGVAHFGFDPNGVYIVATPHGHSEAGFGTIWCSYHSDTSSGKQLVPYAEFALYDRCYQRYQVRCQHHQAAVGRKRNGRGHDDHGGARVRRDDYRSVSLQRMEREQR